MIYNHQNKSDCHIQMRDFRSDSSPNSILPPPEVVNTMLSTFRGRPQKLVLGTARIKPVPQVPLRWPQILPRTEDEFLQSFEPDIRGILIYGNPRIPPPFPELCLEKFNPNPWIKQKRKKSKIVQPNYNFYTVNTHVCHRDVKSGMKVIIPIIK